MASAEYGQNARPYDLIRQEIEDLLEEADQWLNGEAPVTEAEITGFELLLKKLRDANKRADDERKRENTPFDIGKGEVQNRYNPLFKDIDRAEKLIKKVLTGWRDQKIEEQRRAAEETRRAAELAKSAAQRVAEIAGTTMQIQKMVENAEEDAQRLERAAARAEKKVGTGLRMRTVPTGTITDFKVTIAHYYRTRPDELMEMLMVLVKTDVRTGVRDIPGVEITETKEAY